MDSRVITTREELLFQLAVGCELEQGLCLQYLFTAFSLKDGFSEGGIHTQEQLTFVRQWKSNILLIAAQEMLHLTQAANLLAAAGGVVQLRRPNFPQPPGYYPTGLPWRLDPFSADVIRRYVCYERPDPWHDPPFTCGHTVPSDEAAKIQELQPFAHLPARLYDELRPRRVSHTTIGELYDAIRGGFTAVPNVIIGGPQGQIDGAIVDFPAVIRVASRDDAIRGIDLIIWQGEGTKRDTMDSHYGMFLNIYNQYEALVARDPEFDPVRPVASNPLSRLHVDNTWPGWRLIDDPVTRQANDLCSNIYETMMLMLYRFFATDAAMHETQRTLARGFLRVMTGVIKSFGEALTQMPMGIETPGKTAGPSFEVNRSIQLLPHEPSAWTYIYERLVIDAGAARDLAARPDLPGERVREAFARAAITLDQIAEGFGDHPPHGRHHGQDHGQRRTAP
jgi:hypothetical protein